MGRIKQFAGAACTATGTVAMSGLVASGAAVYSLAEGLKQAGKIMKEALAGGGTEETVIPADAGDGTAGFGNEKAPHTGEEQKPADGKEL